jgi:hypothetical protein
VQATRWNILFGFPNESEEDVYREIELLRKIPHLRPPGSCARIRLDRYSPHFNSAEEFGLRVEGPSRSEQYLFYGSKGLGRLSYHFQFSYIKPPEEALENAWADLEKVVRNWGASYNPNGLLQYADGELVIVTDRREGNAQEFIVLEGEVAEVYSACGTICPLRVLQAEFADWEHALRELENLRLIFVEDGRVLALAVRTTPP